MFAASTPHGGSAQPARQPKTAEEIAAFATLTKTELELCARFHVDPVGYALNKVASQARRRSAIGEETLADRTFRIK